MSCKTQDYSVKSAYGTVYSVESERQNVWTFPMGVKFHTEMDFESGWIVKPQVGFGAIFAAGDLYDRSTSTMPGYESPVHSEMQVVDKVTGDIDFNIHFAKDQFGIFLDYDVQFSESRLAHGVTAKFEYRF